jgi:hypothetical protein
MNGTDLAATCAIAASLRKLTLGSASLQGAQPPSIEGISAA